MLSRTVLRFCALEALRPTAVLLSQNPTWPTLAGAHVFDTRFDPIDNLDPDERRPAIAVYTEATRTKSLSQAGFEYDAQHDLVFELAVISMGEGENGEYVAGAGESDAEIEADLDLIEEQILFALSVAPSGVLFRKIARIPLDDWQSNVQRSSEDGRRLAMRTVRVPIKMKPLCYDPAPRVDATGLDRLPAPLRGVVKELAATSYGARIATGLAPAVPNMPANPHDVSSIAINMHLKSPPAAPGADEQPHIVAIVDGLQGS